MITIVIADPDATFRRGLQLLLQDNTEFKICGETADCAEALKLTLDLNPDILLLELRTHSLRIEAVMAAITEQKKHTKIIILAENCEKQNALSIRRGVYGFIDKSADPAGILDVVKMVNSGETSFPAEVAQIWLAQHRTVGQGPKGRLTKREMEVLTHIAGGNSNKEIAAILVIGVRTVETHRERIMRKLDTHSIAGLTRYAVAKGLVSLA